MCKSVYLLLVWGLHPCGSVTNLLSYPSVGAQTCYSLEYFVTKLDDILLGFNALNHQVYCQATACCFRGLHALNVPCEK